MQIRPLRPADAPEVLALNEEVVHHLAPLDAAGLTALIDQADLAWAIGDGSSLAGFVIVLAPGQAYGSDNYRWFSQRYPAFLYLDRVAVAADHRRQGVASRIYAAVEAEADRRGVPLLLEVNIEPPNEPSLAFHRGRGFVEVGRLTHDDGAKQVSLMARPPADQQTS